jgi:NAD(P)-dependent dehydrogenase (short-subunit alcohol dehydrogenase family)
MDPWHLASAVIPVTGGASGIGLAICKRLREAGAQPLLLDVDARQLESALREVYPEGDASRFGYVVDVRDARAVDACFEQVHRDHGPATHAVANAGIVGRGNILELPDEVWHEVMAVNLDGTLYTCRAAARHMIGQGRGAIVLMASIAGLRVKQGRVAYAASKAGIIQMTRGLALEWGPLGIRVNGVAPGIVDTPMQQANPSAAVTAVVRALGAPAHGHTRRDRQRRSVPAVGPRELRHRPHRRRGRRSEHPVRLRRDAGRGIRQHVCTTRSLDGASPPLLMLDGRHPREMAGQHFEMVRHAVPRSWGVRKNATSHRRTYPLTVWTN